MRLGTRPGAVRSQPPHDRLMPHGPPASCGEACYRRAMTKPCGNFPRVDTLEELVERDKDHDCQGLGPHHICVRVEAVAKLPSRFGSFHIVAFWNNRDGKEHVAMVHGDVMGAEDVPTRLQSECLTGDVMGS